MKKEGQLQDLSRAGVGSRARLDDLEKIKISCPCRKLKAILLLSIWYHGNK